MNGFAAVAAQFVITYLPETDEFHVRMPAARRGSDRMGTHLPDDAAVGAWCVRTWQLNCGRA